MGSKKPFQRKQARNPGKKTSRKAKNRWNIPMEGAHPLVRENWDKKLTLKENYIRLGIASHLNGHAGGTVLTKEELAANAAATIAAAAAGTSGDSETEDLNVAKPVIEWKTIKQMDEEKALAMAKLAEDMSSDECFDIYATPLEGNLLPLDERVLRIGSKLSQKKKTAVVAAAAANATPAEKGPLAQKIISKMEEEAANSRTLERHQSEQEMMVLEALIARHGGKSGSGTWKDWDWQAMARDTRLNKYQLSVGQLQKKAKRFLLLPTLTNTASVYIPVE